MSNSLKYFRRVAECEGFPPMLYESLELSIAYTSEEELLRILRLLGIEPKIFRTAPPQPEPGKSYGNLESNKFPRLIPGHLIEQPGHCIVFGVKVYIFCKEGAITMSIDPTGGGITEQHVMDAQLMEPTLASLQLTNGVRLEAR